MFKKENLFLILAACALALALMAPTATCLAASEGFHARHLRFHDTVTLGHYALEVHARRAVNVESLLDGVTGEEEFEGLQAKIDANRLKLFPSREIAVVISDESVTADGTRASEYLNCTKQIYWWNNTNLQGYYWYAKYSANVATMFVQVLQGGYKLRRFMNGAWQNLFYNATQTGTAAGWVSGYQTLVGYKGIGQYGTNKAHIVMFFFN